MTERGCDVEGCARPHHARGHCAMHARRLELTGKVGPAESVNRGVARIDGDLPGITYRQLDHWVRRGWLHPDRNGTGSGVWRSWSDDERRVADRMARLVSAGLKPEAAADIARHHGIVEPVPGVLISIYDVTP